MLARSTIFSNHGGKPPQLAGEFGKHKHNHPEPISSSNSLLPAQRAIRNWWVTLGEQTQVSPTNTTPSGWSFITSSLRCNRSRF
jgi:hypothetical protein